MLFLSVFVLLASGTGHINAQGCNADNCARAVTGTANGLPVQSSRKADCSSFLKVTVTPKTSTATIYQTVTSATSTQIVSTETDTTVITASTETDTIVVTTSTNIAENAKRQVTIIPSLVPSYASACSGSVRYSSACSCFGVTRTTFTAPTPVTTTTVIVSATPTAYVTATTILTSSVTATTLVTSTQVITACGGVTPGGGTCGCSYTETCNTQLVSTDGRSVTTNNAGGLAACLVLCDDNFQCAAFVYQKSTDACTQIKGSYNTVANSDYVSGPQDLGSRCTGVCTQSYKRNLEGILEDSMILGRDAMADPKPAGGKKLIGAI